MKDLYVLFWWKSSNQRGECYQHIQQDDRGFQTVVGYVDETGAVVTLPEPHEGTLVNPRNILEKLPNASE